MYTAGAAALRPPSSRSGGDDAHTYLYLSIYIHISLSLSLYIYISL